MVTIAYGAAKSRRMKSSSIRENFYRIFLSLKWIFKAYAQGHIVPRAQDSPYCFLPNGDIQRIAPVTSE